MKEISERKIYREFVQKPRRFAVQLVSWEGGQCGKHHYALKTVYMKNMKFVPFM